MYLDEKSDHCNLLYFELIGLDSDVVVAEIKDVLTVRRFPLEFVKGLGQMHWVQNNDLMARTWQFLFKYLEC